MVRRQSRFRFEAGTCRGSVAASVALVACRSVRLTWAWTLVLPRRAFAIWSAAGTGAAGRGPRTAAGGPGFVTGSADCADGTGCVTGSADAPGTVIEARPQTFAVLSVTVLPGETLVPGCGLTEQTCTGSGKRDESALSVE